MLMPGRNFSSDSYSYGFNGKENNNEIYGNSNLQDYGMRLYNVRLGKFLSIDPYLKNYPWNSTYAFAENDVIRNIDLDGLEKVLYIYDFSGKKITKSIIELVSAGPFGNGVAIMSNKGGTTQFYYGNEIVSSGDKGKAFLKRYEGYVNKVYFDTKGFATIGFGHLVKDDEKNYFTSGCYIDQSEGDEIFEADFISNSQKGINRIKGKNPDITLSTNEEDALEDIFFNMGPKYAESFTSEKGGDYFFNYMADRELWYRRFAESVLYTDGLYIDLREKNDKKSNKTLAYVFDRAQNTLMKPLDSRQINLSIETKEKAIQTK